MELDVEEELLELEEDEELGEDVGVLLFEEDTEPIGLELGAPAQLTTSMDNKVVINNCLFMNISPNKELLLSYMSFVKKTYEISMSSFFKIWIFIPFIPSIPSVLGTSCLGVCVGLEFPNYVLETRKNKNLSPFVRRCEGERLDTTGLGDYWWRC